MSPQQTARPVRNPRHSTTVDLSVVGLLVQAVANEIDGIHEAMLEKVVPVTEQQTDNGGAPEKAEPVTKFDESATVVLHIKLIPYINEQVSPIANDLRNRVIERIQQITNLKVHAVHIHVAGLWFR